MIRHTVLFKVKAGVSKATVDHAIASFLNLKNKLPGLVTMAGGQCDFHEDKNHAAFKHIFSHGFSIDFKDQAAYDQFLRDPITHPAKEAVINIAEGGYDGIVGFDFFEK